MRLLALLCWGVAMSFLAPLAVLAQEPPDTLRPDTIPADTIPADPVPGDTLRADSLGLDEPDALREPGDTLSADTIFYNLPRVEAPIPAGWAQGVWSWDMEDILAAGAVSLADLLAEVPGVVPLQAGDYGNPSALTAFGLGGGRVRILRDGFEVLPLAGGVTDLSRIGLAGIARVRFERSMGELVIHMDGLEFEDGRPYSLVEAGTGDLNTNSFRGTFANPTALGGSVAVALERTDSQGARGDEPGNVTGTWFRYQLHRGDAAGLGLDYRRVTSENSGGTYPSPISRTDWTVRGRVALAPGVNAEGYWGTSSHDVDDERPAYLLEGGSRSQLGARLAARRSGLFAQGEFRRFGGDDLPSHRLDLTAGADLPQLGGFSASLTQGSFDGSSTGARQLRGWTRPVAGLSLFGSWESGTYGARTFPVQGPPLPDSLGAAEPEPDSVAMEADPVFRITDRTTTRYGAQWAWRDIALSGARLRVEADSLLPLGFVPDLGQPALVGGVREGWEVWGRLPMPLNGLRLEGSLQQWDEGWSYLPRRTYRGAFTFHRTYLESGNFEWWWTLGVRGHDPMTVRQVVGDALDEDGEVVGPQLAEVPFYQNWYARVQIRIVSVRIFVGWENFTIRRDLEQVPGRLLPITRAFYGLRWTLWN